jgi:hypothetical protein
MYNYIYVEDSIIRDICYAIYVMKISKIILNVPDVLLMVVVSVSMIFILKMKINARCVD